MQVEFVGSRPCSEGFSPGSPVFIPPQKSTLLNSKWKQWTRSHFVEMPLQTLVFMGPLQWEKHTVIGTAHSKTIQDYN